MTCPVLKIGVPKSGQKRDKTACPDAAGQRGDNPLKGVVSLPLASRCPGEKCPDSVSRSPAAWGNVMDRILLSLRDDGPATRAQLERRVGLDPKNAGQTVSRLVAVMDRPLADRGRRRAHIAGWTRDEHEGGRAYPRPIYAYGHGANAPKPPPQTSKAVQARYWLARKERLAGAAA